MNAIRLGYGISTAAIIITREVIRHPLRKHQKGYIESKLQALQFMPFSRTQKVADLFD